MKTDDEWMALALDQARGAAAAGDVPVGAVIVREDVLVASAGNRREQDCDPTAHAEVVALRAAAHQLGRWRVDATLYVTQEPCPMCAGALVNARVSRLVYGCANPKAGAITTLFQLATDARLNHRIEVLGGVGAEESAQLLSKFFADLRTGPKYK